MLNFCFHKWTLWSNPQLGTETETWFGKTLSKHTITIQTRKCIKCNKLQIREISH